MRTFYHLIYEPCTDSKNYTYFFKKIHRGASLLKTFHFEDPLKRPQLIDIDVDHLNLPGFWVFFSQKEVWFSVSTIELNIIEQHLPTFTKPSKWSSLSTWSTFLCRVCFSFRDYISLKLKTTFRHFKFSQWQQPKTCFHGVCTPLIFVNDFEWKVTWL